MVHRKFIIVFAVFLVVGAASFSLASGVPDPTYCEVSFHPCELSCQAVMFNVPNGLGSAFTEARTLDERVDASIMLLIRDGEGIPIVGYPAVDVRLAMPGGGTVFCPNGSIADGASDINGIMTWVNPLRAGGWSEGHTLVMIDGQPLVGDDDPCYLAHNSPDINGDLIVNLMDLGQLAQDYFGDYTFRSDFHYDGVVNLSDVPKFARNYGAACP